MDIVSLGLSAIHKGFEQLAKVAEKIGTTGDDDLADDAVSISLSKLQVGAGSAIIKVSKELDDAVLSITDDKDR